jgi:hypothetical protein
MCGSCAHPDQSPLLARAALLRNDLWVRTSTAILLFFILGGVAIHDCLLSGYISFRDEPISFSASVYEKKLLLDHLNFKSSALSLLLV